MEKEVKLYMIMLGCRPEGRYTEQHDIFFGIGSSLKELIPSMKQFWPEAKGKIHIDAWREITAVDGYSISVTEKKAEKTSDLDLFFINLGGYKVGEFEEYHYKMVTVAETIGLAAKKARATTFYKHCGFDGAVSHIDDKFGIDVDDAYAVNDILPGIFKANYTIQISKAKGILSEDELHIGYLKLDKAE
jgi:Domain of Unknown Function (DUF1543)